MAICNICGAENKKKPDTWTNWECAACVRDLLQGSVGVYNKAERRICGRHASALPEDEDGGQSYEYRGFAEQLADGVEMMDADPPYDR